MPTSDTRVCRHVVLRPAGERDSCDVEWRTKEEGVVSTVTAVRRLLRDSLGPRWQGRLAAAHATLIDGERAMNAALPSSGFGRSLADVCQALRNLAEAAEVEL